MKVVTQIRGFKPRNEDAKEQIYFLKKELKARLVLLFKHYIEGKITDENIMYSLSPIDRDTIFASIEFDLALSKKHNDIGIVFNPMSMDSYFDVTEEGEQL